MGQVVLLYGTSSATVLAQLANCGLNTFLYFGRFVLYAQVQYLNAFHKFA